MLAESSPVPALALPSPSHGLSQPRVAHHLVVAPDLEFASPPKAASFGHRLHYRAGVQGGQPFSRPVAYQRVPQLHELLQ
jgi:hypothetical protein